MKHIYAFDLGETLMEYLQNYSEEEKKLIYNGIYNHSDKDSLSTSFDTLIKAMHRKIN